MNEGAKEAGNDFLDACRAIIAECAKLESPERAARVAVFAMLVMLDGSGEHVGENYRVFIKSDDGSLLAIQFFHHDL